MNANEVEILADAILRDALTAQGYDHVEVREGFDHADEAALFIDAILKVGAPIVPGRVFSQAMTALNAALLERGENRFPYLRTRHPDDERPEEAERKVS